MPKIITEDMIEQAAIKALQERHDCNVLNCMTEENRTHFLTEPDVRIRNRLFCQM